MATRDWFSQELQVIDLMCFLQKPLLFLVKLHGVTAGQLFDYLQSKKIYVRYFPKWSVFRIKLRISIELRMRWSAQ